MLNNMLMKAYVWATNKRAELAEEQAQGVVEYALVLGVVVVALFLAFMFADLQGALGEALDALTGAFGTDTSPPTS